MKGETPRALASITQTELFCWTDVEELGDLERLALVFENLPDEQLVRRLETRRAHGRNDYPIRPMWNSLLASVVFQHQSTEDLRRDLARNAQLRLICGFPAADGARAVPPAWAYSRFQSSLCEADISAELEAIFAALRERLSEQLPELGKHLGGDGNALASRARRPGRRDEDRRGEHDADWGVQEHRGDNGTRTKVKTWFGFRLHVLADTHYELPLNCRLTRASRNEMPVMHELLDQLAQHAPALLERAQVFTADRGYADSKLLVKLWDTHRIKPVVDIRNSWQDGEETVRVAGTENVVYDYRGTVSCICPQTNTQREMAYGGFEAERETLKYRCPAAHYGFDCAGAEQCPLAQATRIPISIDRRVFTPIARSSYRWEDLYRNRSAGERINGRLDEDFGFEHHTIRGLAKMHMRVTLAFSVVLAKATGRVAEQRHRLMRSLVHATSA
jgi:hypothetical protein